MTTHRPLFLLAPGLAAVALTAALSSCGGPAAPQIGAVAGDGPPAPVPQTLLTLRIGGGTTRAALQATLPAGGGILSFHPESGSAVVGVAQAMTPGTSRLNVQGLGAIRAQVLATEPNARVSAQADMQANGALTWAGGLTTWAGGLTTWAGGLTTWAGSVPYMTPATQTTVGAYWKAIGLTNSSTLAPTQGAGVKVAVMDTGVDMTHALLKAQTSTTQGWDYIGNDASAQEEQTFGGVTGALYGHGTAVAGVILQVAPRATILPYRVLRPDGSGDVSTLILAIDRAVADGAGVINLSLGLDSDSAALNAAIRSAIGKNVLVSNSSGNTGAGAMLYPARTSTPTDALLRNGLLAVGSVDAGGARSSFSTYAANMSLVAPGSQIVTAYPGGRLVSTSGTSFAAPAVSGALALGLDLNSRLPGSARVAPADVSMYLKNFTTRTPDAQYGDLLGSGILNVSEFLTGLKSAAGGKVITNPGFESGLDGWSLWSSGDPASEIRVTGERSSLGRRAVILGSSTGNAAFIYNASYAFVAGKTYTVSADVLNAGTSFCSMGVDFQTPGGKVNQWANTAATGFTRLSQTFTMPATFTTTRVYGWKDYGAGTCVIDNLTVTEQ